MAGMGPAPKQASARRRRNAVPGTIFLPSEGRADPAPAWPFGRSAPAERALWADLWATPQAVAWQRLGWVRVVGRYVRLLLEAEKPKAPVNLLAEVRQLEDRLGLTPMAMLRLRWEIVVDELAEVRGGRAAVRAVEPRRVRAVDTSAVAGA